MFRNSKSSVRLNNDTKTREARELWNVREVVGPSMENFGTGNLPSLVCNFSSYSFFEVFGTRGNSDLLHCSSFLHKSNRATIFFPLPPSLHTMPLSQIYIYFFHSSTMKFRGIFARFSTTALYSLYR